MATTTINASKQTRARSGTQSSWSAARGATSSANHTNYTTTQTNVDTAINVIFNSGRGGGAYIVNRSFFFFDTSTVTGTITAIDLKIYGVTNGGESVRVAESTAFGGGGGSAYANTDFDGWLNPGGSIIPVPYTAANHTWTAGGTNTIALNSTAISDADSDEYLNLVIVDNLDYNNLEPAVSLSNPSGMQFASSTTFPQLFITHTIEYANSVNGLLPSKYAKVNSLTKSQISKINGA